MTRELLINLINLIKSLKNRTLRWRSIALCCIFLMMQTAHAGEMQIYTDEDPPVNFVKNGKTTGIASEVVMEIQRRVGNHAPINVFPWARDYQTALSKGVTCLYPTMRTQEREHLFKWVGPVLNVMTGFYALRDNPVQIQSMVDAKALSPILIPRLYYSQQYLSAQGFTNLEIVDNSEIMIHMFLVGRRPVFVNDNLSLSALLEKFGAKKQDVRLLYSFMKSQSYIAFSTDTPDEVVRQWQNALNDMKRDGSFAKLYQAWLPGETPPGLSPDVQP